MDIIRPSELLRGAAVKRLSATEVDRDTSHGHEFQGSAPLRTLLGREDRDFACRYVFLSDSLSDPQSDIGRLTWYDARANQPHRSAEFRGYFRTELIWRWAQPGDLLVLAVLSDQALLGIVVERDSSWERFFGWLLGGAPSSSGEWAGADLSHPMDFVLAADLAEALGVVLPESSTKTIEEVAHMAVERAGTTLADLLNLPTRQVSELARHVASSMESDVDPSTPDEALLLWMNTEEQLFRLAEAAAHGDRVRGGFDSMDAFVDAALSVLNTRKSRAGHALENHFSEILRFHFVPFDEQAITEGRSRPDFLVPGSEEYHNPSHPPDPLFMIAVKRTCKDRWRQILTEADRIPVKHLLTLQSPITDSQLAEMATERVRVVVPRPLHGPFSAGAQGQLLNVSDLLEVLPRRP